MTKKVGGHRDFQQNEIRKVRIENLAAAPSSPVAGQIYFDTTLDQFGVYDGTTWVYLSASGALDFGEAADISSSNFGDTAAAGASGEVADAGHRHPREANPVTAHEAAGDPHTGYQLESEKGTAGGYASLDGAGRVPASQLPVSAMEYKGTWDASTNTPTLADGTGSTGDLYRVSAAGTQNLGSGAITFGVGDYVIYNGTTWEKGDTTDAVSSVHGRTGAVTAQVGDYTTFYVRTYTVTIGDGSTVAHTINHALGTEDVDVVVRYAGGGKEAVDADWEVDDSNNVTVRWEPAASTNELRVMVMGKA